MHNPIQGIIVAPLTILLAYEIGTHKLKYDISYGIFIYHMIVIGGLLCLGVTGYIGIVLTIFISPILGFISCKYIEKPVLKAR